VPERAWEFDSPLSHPLLLQTYSVSGVPRPNYAADVVPTSGWRKVPRGRDLVDAALGKRLGAG
jgi:hypothetical protein